MARRRWKLSSSGRRGRRPQMMGCRFGMSGWQRSYGASQYSLAGSSYGRRSARGETLVRRWHAQRARTGSRISREAAKRELLVSTGLFLGTRSSAARERQPEEVVGEARGALRRAHLRPRSPLFLTAPPQTLAPSDPPQRAPPPRSPAAPTPPNSPPRTDTAPPSRPRPAREAPHEHPPGFRAEAAFRRWARPRGRAAR